MLEHRVAATARACRVGGVALLFGCGLLAGPAARATPAYGQAAKLVPASAEAAFAPSMALSAGGAFLVMGATDSPGGDRGAVWVYARPAGGWAAPVGDPLAQLYAADGTPGDRFGAAVAVSADGSVIAVGAPGRSGTGVVYMFERAAGGGWQETGFLASAPAGAQLGTSVALSADGSLVAAGAPGLAGASGATATAAPGGVFVYTRLAASWRSASLPAMLTASAGAAGDLLGTAVALSADTRTLLAGAPTQEKAGTAYVFVRSGPAWVSGTETARLTAGGGAPGDSLGFAVALSGDGGTAAAGAPFAPAVAEVGPGAVYVFTRPAGGWATATQTATLAASDALPGAALGISVAASADGFTIAAGAADVLGPEADGAGSVYLFARRGATWTSQRETGKVAAADGAAGNLLGNGMAMTGDGAVLAATAPAIGASYVFTLPAGRCVADNLTLCVDEQPGDSRFQVTAAFTSAAGNGAARAVSTAGLGLASGGIFWFFAPNDPEILFKVLDGCQFDAHFWVFFSAATNVGFSVTVTDTLFGSRRTYSNPAGTAALPVQDTAAFPCP